MVLLKTNINQLNIKKMILNAKDLFEIYDDMDTSCIEFAEWIEKNINGNLYNHWKSGKLKTIELLEMWKEEKFKHLINK
jgi:hypothetical protein